MATFAQSNHSLTTPTPALELYQWLEIEGIFQELRVQFPQYEEEIHALKAVAKVAWSRSLPQQFRLDFRNRIVGIWDNLSEMLERNHRISSKRPLEGDVVGTHEDFSAVLKQLPTSRKFFEWIRSLQVDIPETVLALACDEVLGYRQGPEGSNWKTSEKHSALTKIG